MSFIAPPEISVHHDVGSLSQAAFPEVHQEECQIVEHIPRRNGLVEFHRIEKRRLAIQEDEVSKMQVAMATSHESLRAALPK
jgi:hypothetical protein